MIDEPFQKGTVIKRSTIHDTYGGSRQAGISTSANFPFIFIFSLKSGHQHGYKDQWENKDIFSYTGEGQIGNMEFARGNLALRDHLINNKRVFLFSEVRKTYVMYVGELEIEDLGCFEAKDREGNNRIAIKFFFRKAGIKTTYSAPHDLILAESVEEYLKVKVPNVTERSGLVTSRVGQGAYRKSILYRWEFKCAVTKFTNADILIASHVVPWKDSSNDERLDVDNGILLSPNYDALFDQHLISFENSGKIILSDILLESNFQELGVTGKEIISGLSQGNFTYLERHRNLITF